jgi:hypothetical protein
MKKENFALTILSILIFAFLVLTIILFTGCDQIMAELPKDFPVINTDTIEENPVDTIPIDTIVTPPIDSIVFECEAYEEIDTPLFISFFVNLDVPLFLDSNIYYQAFPSAPIEILNPETFFDTIYYSGINIAGFKSGTSNADQYNSVTRIWMLNGLGGKHHLSFGSHRFNFRGAIPYPEYQNVREIYRSCQLLKYQNTGYTCEEIVEDLEWRIEGCYETPDIIDLRPISIGTCVIPVELIEECENRGSIVYQ